MGPELGIPRWRTDRSLMLQRILMGLFVALFACRGGAAQPDAAVHQRVGSIISPSPVYPPFSATAFGAIGDGVADDTTAIQNACNAVAVIASSGIYGGFVQLPQGVYKISAPIILANGVGLKGAGPNATIIRATSTFSDTAMITNLHQDGTQEYAFVESLLVDGNSGSGASETIAVINFVSLFVNSYIRDVIVENASTVGIHIGAAGSPGGGGPFLLENDWVVSSGTDNVLIDETAGNAGSVAGITSVRLTSEHEGSGYSAVRIHGRGHMENTALYNTHIEQRNTGSGTVGITIDGAPDTLIDGLQLQAASAGSLVGVEITNATASVREQIRAVSNINLINPVINDDYNTVSFGAVDVPWYSTPDVGIQPRLTGTACSGNNSIQSVSSQGAMTCTTGVLGASNTTQTSWSYGVGATIGTGDANANIKLIDTTSTAAGVGGAMLFYGAYTGTSTTIAAQIKASKADSSGGDYGFDLLFATRKNGANDTAQVLKIGNDKDVTFSGNVSDIGSTPSISGCGTSGATITGGAHSGTVNTTTGATSCVLTFATALTGTPSCNVQDVAGGVTPAMTIATGSLTFTAVAGDTFTYECWGH